MFIYKIDDDVSLRLVELNDAERIFELTDASRAYLRNWLPWLDFTKTVEDSRAYVRNSMKDCSEGRSMNTVILFKGEIVGVAGFNTINASNKNVSIGYWLGEAYQGNGIMTKVAAALTEYAFSHLRFNRVEIRAAAENDRSRSIPERLGFVNEGRIRQAEWLYDHFVDHIVYGMLASEWKSNSDG